MSKEDVLKVQTCVLKVNIHCDGCEKKVKKILHKINGVYQSRIDADQGKVTVSGLVDPSAVVRKLNRAGKPAALWGYKPGVVNQQPQRIQQYGGGGDAGGKGQPKDAGGKAQQGGAGGGGGEDAKAVLPLPLPTPQQLQMKGMMELPPPLTGGKMPFPASSAPAEDPKAVKFGLPEDEFDDDDEGSELDDEFDDFDDGESFEGDGFDDDDDDDLDDGPETVTKFTAAVPPGGGKKGGGGGEIPVQIKGNADSGGGGKKDPGGKQNQGRSGGGGQPPQNGRGGGNQPGQGEKGGPTGGMPPPGMTRANMVGGMPQPGAVRPNMMGGAGFPGTGQMGGGPMGRHHPHMGGVQHGGAGAVHGMHAGAGFYQGGGGGMQPVGPEVLQGNPMTQQQYMAMMQQQQQQQMMLNGGHGGHHGHGAAGYPPMHRYPMMAYPPHADPYNIFSDENPNSSCSVM